MSRLLKLLFIVLCALNVSCLDKNDKNAEEDELLEQIVTLEKEIDALISEALCEENKQCGYIEMGSKPCGGPASFKIYSSLNTDTTLLIEKSHAHIDLSKEYNALTGLTSDCSIEQPPAVICDIKCISN